MPDTGFASSFPLPASEASRRCPALTALIRFSDSAATLPQLLRSLATQTVVPGTLVGIDNRSRDGSREILSRAGAQLLDWPHAYHHSKVLNHGLARCSSPFVLIISSHNVLDEPTAIEKLLGALAPEDIVGASPLYASETFGKLGDTVRWSDLAGQGLPYASIFSNSCGMIRRSAWLEHPFNESIAIAEDYAWALWHLEHGRRVARVSARYQYLRRGRLRYFSCARHVRALAAAYGLRFGEAGLPWALRTVLEGGFHLARKPREWKTAYAIGRQGWEFTWARLLWPTLLPALRADRRLPPSSP